MFTREGLEDMTYKELQDTARELNLKYVGVSKEDLVESVLGTVESEDQPQEEEKFVEPLGDVEEYAPEEEEPRKTQVSEPPRPKVTTTKNMDKSYAPEVVPEVKVRAKLVRIKPKKDVPTSHIGDKVWSLKAGKVYEVPMEVAEIFERGGYL